MRVRLDYGKTGIDAELPDANVIATLRITPAPRLPEPLAAIRAALNAPIGTLSLAELAAGKRNACLIVCDITRPVPNSTLLPPILEILNAAGIPDDKITILVATGTHRPNLGAELDALLGAEIAAKIRVVNHDGHHPAMMRDFGFSPNGVPVRLNKTYCDAELKLTVGLIEPHFMAGYSGGRKLIMPGIAAFATVQNWHCPRFLESPLATMGVVDGNPVHEESLAIAKMVRPDLMLDVTLDEQNQITGIFAGDLEQAWRAGVAFAASHVRAEAPELADIVVTSCAGHPLDTTFYQAVKGMVGALPVVKQGGTIVIAAQCAEGVGSPDFTKSILEANDLEEFVAYISQPEVFVPEEWQIEELARAARKANIICIAGGISPEVLSRCFVTPAATVEEGVALALAQHGADAKIVVIPRGPYVIPFAKEHSVF